MSFRLLFAAFIVHAKTFNALIHSFWNSTPLICPILQHYACSLSPAHSDVKDKHDRLRRSQVPYRIIGLGELVYSVFLGHTSHRMCTCRRGDLPPEQEVDRKTPKSPPVEIVSGEVRLTRTFDRFSVPQNS